MKKALEMAEDFVPTYSFEDDRLNELKNIFPEVFEDGFFNLETLKQIIGEKITDGTVKEHFGLNWIGKQDARKIAAKAPTGTLKPCPGQGLFEDSAENLFIEGDNLEVLKIMRKSYMGRIKMIYIDPPYNTGTDLIYNDIFADSTEDYLRKSGEKSDEGLLVSNPKSSGKFHANWLTFMYPRLRLARDLMSEDGVMFISIDNNEVENLKSICNEIFGEENSEIYIWDTREDGTMPKTAKKTVRKENEFLIAVFKNNLYKELYKYSSFKYKDNTDWTNPDDDPRGPWMSGNISRGEEGGNEDSEKFFTIVNPVGVKFERHWSITEPEFEELLKDGRIYFADKGNGVPRKKIFRDEPVLSKQSSLFEKLKSSQSGKNEVKDLLGFKAFDYPKPTNLIDRLVQIGTKDNDIVLDFFAGSGTTAHSVAKVNEEFTTNRKFICIQLPEKIEEKHEAYKNGYRYISEVTKTRITKALSMTNQGFKMFKQDASTIYKWEEFQPEQDGALPDLFSKLEAAYKNPLKENTSEDNFLTEILLQEGFPLTARKKEVIKGVYKITHPWVPYTLFGTMLDNFKDVDFSKLMLSEEDHFVCLDAAFKSDDALKQQISNQCKLFTI